MATSKATLRLASQIAASLLDGYNEWVEACEQDRRDGYRASSCEHGMNLHVDYDPICGPCEDGLTMRDGVQRRAFALDSAKRRMEQVTKITHMATDLRELGVKMDTQPFIDRITELLTVRY
jgi:hypothetical protein